MEQNPFDAFDAPAAQPAQQANPFDAFDAPAVSPSAITVTPTQSPAQEMSDLYAARHPERSFSDRFGEVASGSWDVAKRNIAPTLGGLATTGAAIALAPATEGMSLLPLIGTYLGIGAAGAAGSAATSAAQDIINPLTPEEKAGIEKFQNDYPVMSRVAGAAPLIATSTLNPVGNAKGLYQLGRAALPGGVVTPLAKEAGLNVLVNGGINLGTNLAAKGGLTKEDAIEAGALSLILGRPNIVGQLPLAAGYGVTSGLKSAATRGYRNAFPTKTSSDTPIQPEIVGAEPVVAEPQMPPGFNHQVWNGLTPEGKAFAVADWQARQAAQQPTPVQPIPDPVTPLTRPADIAPERWAQMSPKDQAAAIDGRRDLPPLPNQPAATPKPETKIEATIALEGTPEYDAAIAREKARAEAEAARQPAQTEIPGTEDTFNLTGQEAAPAPAPKPEAAQPDLIPQTEPDYVSQARKALAELEAQGKGDTVKAAGLRALIEQKPAAETKPAKVSEDAAEVVAAKTPPETNIDKPLPESDLERFYREKAKGHEDAAAKAKADGDPMVDAVGMRASEWELKQAKEMHDRADAVRRGDNEQAVRDSQGINRSVNRDESGAPEPTRPADADEDAAPAKPAPTTGLSRPGKYDVAPWGGKKRADWLEQKRAAGDELYADGQRITRIDKTGRVYVEDGKGGERLAALTPNGIDELASMPKATETPAAKPAPVEKPATPVPETRAIDPANEVPKDYESTITAVQRLAGKKLSIHAKEELGILAEEGLNPDFLDEAGIKDLRGHLEDVNERLDTAIDAARTETPGMKPKDAYWVKRGLREAKRAVETAIEKIDSKPAGQPLSAKNEPSEVSQARRYIESQASKKRIASQERLDDAKAIVDQYEVDTKAKDPAAKLTADELKRVSDETLTEHIESVNRRLEQDGEDAVLPEEVEMSKRYEAEIVRRANEDAATENRGITEDDVLIDNAKAAAAKGIYLPTLPKQYGGSIIRENMTPTQRRQFLRNPPGIEIKAKPTPSEIAEARKAANHMLSRWAEAVGQNTSVSDSKVNSDSTLERFQQAIENSAKGESRTSSVKRRYTPVERNGSKPSDDVPFAPKGHDANGDETSYHEGLKKEGEIDDDLVGFMLEEGDFKPGKAAGDVLREIVRLNGRFSNVAKVLLEISDFKSLSIPVTIASDHDGGHWSPLGKRVNWDAEPDASGNHPFSYHEEIVIGGLPYSSEGTIGTVERVAIEEIAHAITMSKIPNDLRRALDESLKKQLEKAREKSNGGPVDRRGERAAYVAVVAEYAKNGSNKEWRDLCRAFVEFRAKAEQSGQITSDPNGVGYRSKDLAEFMIGALLEPKSQRILAGIEDPERKQSMLRTVIDAVMRVFRISKEKMESMLGTTLSAIEKIAGSKRTLKDGEGMYGPLSPDDQAMVDQGNYNPGGNKENLGAGIPFAAKAGAAGKAVAGMMDVAQLSATAVLADARVLPGVNPIAGNLHLLAEGRQIGALFAGQGQRFVSSPSMKEVAEMFAIRDGNNPKGSEETFYDQRDAQRRIFKGKLTAAFDPIAGKIDRLGRADLEALDKRLAQMITGEIPIDNSTPEGQVAEAIKALADEAHGYAKEAGLDLGYVKDYGMPHSVDVAKIDADHAGFLAAATRAYAVNNPIRIAQLRSKLIQLNKQGPVGSDEIVKLNLELADLSIAKPAEQAKAWLDNILLGAEGADSTMSLLMDGGTATNNADFMKQRVFAPQARAILRDYFRNDPRLAWEGYIDRVTQSAEFARRFGAKGEKWMAYVDGMRQDGASEVQIQAFRDHVKDALGILTPRPSPGHALANSLLGLSNMAKLKMTSLANFLEPLAIAARGTPIDGMLAPLHMVGNTIRLLGELNPGEAARFREVLGREASTENGDISLARAAGLIDAAGSHEILCNSGNTIDSRAEYDANSSRAAQVVHGGTNALARAYGLEVTENAKRATVARFAANRIDGFVDGLVNDGTLARAWAAAKPVSDNPFSIRAESRMRLRRAGLADDKMDDFANAWIAARKSGEFSKWLSSNDEFAVMARKAIRMEASTTSVNSNRAFNVGGEKGKLVSQDQFLGKALMTFLRYPSAAKEQIFGPMVRDVKSGIAGKDADIDLSAYSRVRMMSQAMAVPGMMIATAAYLYLRDMINNRDDKTALQRAVEAYSYTGAAGGKAEFFNKLARGEIPPVFNELVKTMQNISRAEKGQGERVLVSDAIKYAAQPAAQGTVALVLPPPLNVLAARLIGSKEAREKVVDETMGEKKTGKKNRGF